MSNTAIGSQLFYQVSSTWTEITNIMELDSPDFSIDDLKSTKLSSTSHEWLPGLGDIGEVSGSVIYSAAQVNVFNSLRGVVHVWKISFRDGLTAQFSGYVKSFSSKMNPEDLEVIEFKIKGSGDLTITGP